jgi:hypothetical protein
LRAIAFQRQDIAEPYLYLLDIEAFDEAWKKSSTNTSFKA